MFAWIAFFFSALTFLHSDVFIDLADEGFLWYGVLQVLQGMIPIRDFQSYDPGRYYWCAAIMSVCCKGLMSLRFSMGVFQFVSLCSGLAVIQRINKSIWFLLVSGLVMTAWMLVAYRYIDAGMALIALFFAVRLAENPSYRRHLVAGIFTGIAVFFGINHGLYVFAGMAALILYLNVKKSTSEPFKKTMGYVFGLCLGLAPFGALFAFVPGFAESYRQQLSMMAWVVSTGRAVTSNPVTWPWDVSWAMIDPRLTASTGRMLEFIHVLTGSCLYLFMPVYYVLASVQIWKGGLVRDRTHAVWVASFFIGLAYFRHAFSHNNICYLGEGILPIWVGLSALVVMGQAAWFKRVMMGAMIFFLVASLGAAGLVHPITFKHMVSKQAMTWVPIGQDKIWLPKEDAQLIGEVKALVSAYVEPNELILMAPLMTTFYCLLEKESPVNELYFHTAPLPIMERKTIGQLEEKHVRWAIVGHVQIDGRPETELPTSHPLLWKYLQDKFEVVPTPSLKNGYFLMKRKE